MSVDLDTSDHEHKRDEALDRLYALREEWQIIAQSEGPYTKYAENALRRLREEGYDV